MIYLEVNQEALESLAAEMASSASPGCRYFLFGDLGMGKSTFARAFLRALGVTGQIPSPTFIIDSVYSIPDSDLTVHHMDLYRLEGAPGEIEMLGFEDIFESSAVVLVEWPDRIPDIRDRRGCTVRLEPGGSPDTRRVEIDWNLAGY